MFSYILGVILSTSARDRVYITQEVGLTELFMFFFFLLAGATLCKGLNRGIGTLLAGSLSFLIQYIANESGQVLRAVFVGVAVFMIG